MRTLPIPMRRPTFIVSVAVALSAALLVSGHGVGLLAALPAILLWATLACGHYVGERTLARLRRAAGRSRRPRADLRCTMPALPCRTALPGSVLLAFGRGVRGPPASIPAHR